MREEGDTRERKESGEEEERRRRRWRRGRGEAVEEARGEGQVGGKGQREQGSLTGGHSGQGDA